MSIGLLRSVLLTAPLIILATAVYGSASLLASFFDRDGRRQIAIGRAWARMLLRIGGVRVEVSGLEKIDPDGSYIFASNHVSYMDTPAVFANIPVQFRFLAKSELFRIPFIGGHLTKAGHISVPLDAKSALKVMSEASRTLRERGISLLIFPEGGRTEDGHLQEFKDGAAYLAIKAGVPVVPIGLTGMREVLPMHSIYMRPGRVRLNIGDPIPTEGLTIRDRDALTAQIRERVVALMGVLLLAVLPLGAQQTTMTLEEYEPKSTLVVPQHPVERAKFPFIDVHSHHRDLSQERISQVIAAMDRLNMRMLVNSPVSGGSGEWVRRALAALPKDRFLVFTNIPDYKVDEPGYSERIAKQLEADIAAGARGLKVWRNLGMSERDSKGQLIPVDDPRLDAVWQICAKHGIPVLIHTADPMPLFQPMDKYNERWLEQKMRPHRNFAEFRWEDLIAQQHRLFRRHPSTKFIAAHMGWLTHDLGRLGRLLDECPNVYVEIGAVTSELGRQPRNARAFFVRYQDRVLFGKDAWNPAEYPTIFRLLETADEYFPPIRRYHGLWNLYGLDLPEVVLRKLYFANAARLLSIE